MGNKRESEHKGNTRESGTMREFEHIGTRGSLNTWRNLTTWSWNMRKFKQKLVMNTASTKVGISHDPHTLQNKMLSSW